MKLGAHLGNIFPSRIGILKGAIEAEEE